MKSIPLQSRFISIFAGIFVLVALVMLLTVYLVAGQFLQRSVYNSVVLRQKEMDNGVHTIFNEVNIAYARIVFHEDFLRFVSSDTPEEEREEIYEGILSDIALSDLFYDAVAYVDGAFYSPRAGAVFSQGFLAEIEWSENLVTQGDIYTLGGKNYLPVGKKLAAYPLPDTVGYVVFLVDCNALSERCASLEDMGFSMIVRGGDYVVAGGVSEYIGSKILYSVGGAYSQTGRAGEKDVYIVSSPLESINVDYGLDWSVVSILDYGMLFEAVRQLNITISIIGAAALLGGVLLAIFSARRLARPISRFAGRIRGLGRVRTARVYGIREFDQLYAAYWAMLNRIDELLETTRREGESRRKLELESLQMQINPHFLYNTLDAISWMAKINKQPEIDHMILSLAALFRVSLHNGDKFITVREEMELVRNFVQIQKVRFPDRFTFEEEFSPEVAQKYTLKLILQPIVENSVKHGIVGLKRKCDIRVSARLEGEAIVYEVCDDGIGFSPEDVKKKPSEKGGYGLKNVNERIRLEYGNGYGVFIESAPGRGTRITVRIKALDLPPD